jgi:hypothetical protein
LGDSFFWFPENALMVGALFFWQIIHLGKVNMKDRDFGAHSPEGVRWTGTP